MPRIRIEEKGKGPHPSEVVVAIRTAEGVRRLVVDRRSIENGTIDIGHPVASKNSLLLVELPQETLQGHMRVWIHGRDVLDDIPA